MNANFLKSVASVSTIALALAASTTPAGAQSKPTGNYGDSEGSDVNINLRQTDTLDFPEKLINQIPDAYARQAHARMMLMRANNSLTGTFAKMRFMYSRSSDFKTVANDEKAAFAAYQSARDAALAKLADDASYQAVTQLRDELGERLEGMRAIKGVTPDMIAPLAQEKLNYARTASAMEAKALADDPKVAEARDRFVAAGTKLAQAKVEFDDSLRYHPDVEQARLALADARTGAVTSSAYVTGLLKASDVALDYAYFLHRYDRATVAYPAYYDGYGYGSSSYYGGPYYGYRYGK
jgi:hypothetical protein